MARRDLRPWPSPARCPVKADATAQVSKPFTRTRSRACWTAIMPGEAIEEPCYLLHRICRLMALSGLSAISSRTIDVGFSLIAHVTLCDTVGRSREMVPLGDSSIPRLLKPGTRRGFLCESNDGVC